MAAAQLTVHIPPEANPTNVIEMISLLGKSQSQTFGTARDLLEYTAAHGIGSRTEMQSTAFCMGLLDKSSSGIQLSARGKTLAAIREDIWGDVLHFYLYTGWDASAPLNFLQSWAYKLCCDTYWNAGNVQLTVDYLARQVKEQMAAYEVVRLSGLTNMWDVTQVEYLAFELADCDDLNRDVILHIMGNYVECKKLLDKSDA